jgi:alpha-tubulin suppressor-like RCC1 family protein
MRRLRERAQRKKDEIERVKQLTDGGDAEASADDDVKHGATQLVGWGMLSGQRDSAPLSVRGLGSHRIVGVSSGANHALAIAANGAVFSWGANGAGQLGNGSTSAIPYARRIDMLRGLSGVQVACGARHSLVLTSTNDVLAFGANESGQVGIDSNDAREPTPNVISAFAPLNVIAVAAGGANSMALTDAGAVYTFGANESCQLGAHSATIGVARVPYFVQALHGVGVVAIACGDRNSVALQREGTVVQWGYCGASIGARATPEQVAGFKEPIRQIACGRAHSLALGVRGHIYAWGDDAHGQCGGGDGIDGVGALRSSTGMFSPGDSSGASSSTTLVMDDAAASAARVLAAKRAATQEVFRYVSAAGDHSGAVAMTGNVFCWGRNESAQLGVESTRDQHVPTMVASLADKSIEAVECGQRSTYALASSLAPLCYDLAKLLTSGAWSDFSIECRDGKLLRLHRAVLAARCPYFAGIFGRHPQLSALRVFTVSYETLFAVVEYLYSGATHIPVASLQEVFIVATNFGLPNLRRISRFFIDRLAALERDDDDDDDDEDVAAASSSSEPTEPLPPSADAAETTTTTTSTKTLVFGGDKECARAFDAAIHSLVDSPLYTDVTFLCTDDNGKECRVRAHRAILQARSEYFEHLLRAGMAESRTDEMPIRNVSADAFRRLLRHVYGQPLELTGNTVIELLLVANQYRMPLMQHLCETFIAQGIDADNAVAILQISDLVSNRLKHACLTFISEHYDELADSEDFDSLRPSIKRVIRERAKPSTVTRLVNDTSRVGASALLHDLADPFTHERDASEEDDLDSDDDLSQYIIRR